MHAAWLYLLPAILVQEAVTLAAALTQALRAGTSPLAINLAWAIATTIDIALGFWLGRAAQRRMQSWRLVQRAERAAAQIDQRIGESSLRLVLVSLGFIMFPYVNAFIFSWLNVPFSEVFAFLFLGDALYWTFVWGTVTGISFLSGKSMLAVYLAIVTFAVISLIGNLVLHRRRRRSKVTF